METKKRTSTLRGMLCMGLLLCTTFNLVAQASFTYEYDNSGNRIKRDQPLTTKQAPKADFVVSDVELDTQSLAQAQQADLDRLREPFRAKAYPNPTDGKLTVELPDLKDGENGQLRIFSQAGRLVLLQNKVQPAQTVDISNNPSGYYVLHVTVEGRRVTRTIVKR